MLKLFKNSDDKTSFPVPENEDKRQSNVEEYDILDTLPEEEFDALVELAATITGCEVSLMNILDYDRQWSKAQYGYDGDRTMSRSESVCQYTILGDENLEIEDLTEDERFKNKSYVQDDPNFRSYSGYPLKTQGGYNIGALCVLDTKPMKLNDTQKKALKTLADEIMSRLELRKKQHQLEQLNREKDQFLRAVNHDIKSPINGIIGSAHYLQHHWEGDQDELKKMLSMIELSGRKLINYTSELMTNSLKQGETKLHIDDVNIEALIKDLIHIYNPLAKAKKVELNVSCEANSTFKLDNEKFKLILSNLISNALKFSDKGDSITIHAEVLRDENRLLKCSVKDTGIGIPEEFMSTLFKSQKKNQRQGTQGEISTGMGLPLVKQFVDLHKGDIKIDSEEGKGTVFEIVLPEQS